MKKPIKPLYFIIIIIVITAAIFTALSLLRKPPKDQDSRDPELIARVGPNEIRIKQFKQEIEYRKNRGKIDKQALLEEMIEYETLLVKALEAGLDKDPEIVRAYRNSLVGKYKSLNLTPMIENIKISDIEIEKYYNAHRETYTRPEKARLAVLYMKTHSTMSEEKIKSIREKMSEAKEKVLELSGEKGFGKLAISFSEDQTSRYKGGDLGWLSKGRNYRWDEKVIQAGFALENIGDVSDIIDTDKGLYLVKLMDKRDAEITPLEKVNARIKHELLLEKRRQTETNFKQNVRTSVPVKKYSYVLETIQIPDSSGNEKVPALP
ncbi:Putative peptidylprolyl isomerase [Desulfonema limicola]|uniref:peptidylprolyl isomerase n=1 Tax=Desulfonema limicola TaxID=45656 RepID=A0A975B711_9BACT|nr:peptidylprolyl isomerase [Desulfonema limicola]QTA80017.1 Putative peptidylprolyl isomerase [Desulfonema limicola]